MTLKRDDRYQSLIERAADYAVIEGQPQIVEHQGYELLVVPEKWMEEHKGVYDNPGPHTMTDPEGVKVWVFKVRAPGYGQSKSWKPPEDWEDSYSRWKWIDGEIARWIPPGYDFYWPEGVPLRRPGDSPTADEGG